MPFKSKAQRAYMYANHPDIAAEFEAHTPKNAKLPEHVKGAKRGGNITAALKRPRRKST